jgi:hypothetical protein
MEATRQLRALFEKTALGPLATTPKTWSFPHLQTDQIGIPTSRFAVANSIFTRLPDKIRNVLLSIDKKDTTRHLARQATEGWHNVPHPLYDNVMSTPDKGEGIANMIRRVQEQLWYK